MNTGKGTGNMGIRPLSKIRVLDLTQEICGPFCTQLLSDLGAEIIKIEPPEGDRSRRMGPGYGETSLTYIHTNRGKKSVMLDLDNPAQREVFLRLSEKADLIVEDFGPGKAESMGIGYEDIRKRKSDILYLSITSFGKTGPFKDYAANDAIIQAMSGYMSLTSVNYQGTFTKIGPPLADLMAGMYGAIAAVAGVIYRKKTGESLQMDVSKLSAMMQVTADGYAKYLTSGEKGFPTGNAHRMTASFYPMPARDGTIICNAANRNSSEHKFEDFCIGIGMPDFFKDERYATEESRLAHREEVVEAINAHTSLMTVDEINRLCQKCNIAAGVMNDMEQLAADPQTVHDQVIIRVHDEKAGDFKVLGCPYKFDAFDTPSADFSAQPGEHTKEVMTGLLGMAAEEIAAVLGEQEERYGRN